MSHAELQQELGLRDGQFFAFFRHRNQIMMMNGERFCFGDLRDEDIDRIAERMKPGVFEGHNEHHGTRFQQFRCLRVRITKDKNNVVIIEENLERGTCPQERRS